MQRQSDEITYRLHGHEQQFVEVTLDPGEVMLAENGAMMFFEPGIQMDTRMSDGSSQHSGFVGSMLGAAKRKMTGEGMFLSHFENKGTVPAEIAFAAPSPGTIIPIDLSYHKGHVLCQKGAFLCCARGVSISLGFSKKLSSSFFGGEGFVLQSLKGDGIAFIHAGGTVVERELRDGEKLYVDTGSLVALERSVDFDVTVVKGMKNMIFGQEGLFLTSLTGPGKVWLQSLPMPELTSALHHQMVESGLLPNPKK